MSDREILFNCVACMPLRKNIPNPKNSSWKLTNCPVCGRECYESELLRKLKKACPEVKSLCTECSLKKA